METILLQQPAAPIPHNMAKTRINLSPGGPIPHNMAKTALVRQP